MQATFIPSFPVSCRSIPSQLHQINHPRRPLIHKPHIRASLIADKCSYTVAATSSCSKQHHNKNSHPYSEESFSAIDNNSSTNAKINYCPVHLVQNQQDLKEEEIDDKVVESCWGILTNMKWTDLKAAFGQRINLEGIVSSGSVFFKDKHLALPHVAVPDIRWIDWGELQRKGFKGVVFDKDNTLTAPYSLALWPSLRSSLEQCKSIFGGNIAIFSNSAGLQEYDPDGSKAKILEEALGIKVIRHQVKKPAGTSEDIERHFGCESEKLVMVGDRRFTDIVFGNRNGFLTILTDPLTSVEEPLIVQQTKTFKLRKVTWFDWTNYGDMRKIVYRPCADDVGPWPKLNIHMMRKLEAFLSNNWSQSGVKPTCHSLLPDTMECVKDPPPS